MSNGSNTATTNRVKVTAKTPAARMRASATLIAHWTRRAAVRFFWWWLPIVIFLTAFSITYIRTLIPSFEPLTDKIFANHPLWKGTFALLLGTSPDVTSIMLGVLGLSYLFPKMVRRITTIKTHRLGLVILIVAFCFAAIVGNQVNRERQDRWQASVDGNMTTFATNEATFAGNINTLAVNQVLKPNWVDKALQEANLPNRLMTLRPSQTLTGSIGPTVTGQPITPAPTSSSASAPLSSTEIALIRETATAAATGIQQDFDKLQSQADERYRKMRQNTIDSYVQSGHYTKEQAEQLANGMNTPSVWAERAGESAAYGRFAYQAHKEAVQALITVATVHQADLHRELISRILELRQDCFIDRAPGQVQACISKLRDVATEAK